MSLPGSNCSAGRWLATNALASQVTLARRIPSIGMQCEICGATEESDIHALLLCPLATKVWVGSEIEDVLWDDNVTTPMDALLQASKVLSLDRLGEYVAVLWECWNLRNRFIFEKKVDNGDALASRAVAFVLNFRRMRDEESPVPQSTDASCWRPPSLGIFKLNFDAGKVGQNVREWGFVVRDHMGEAVLACVTQAEGFISPKA